MHRSFFSLPARQFLRPTSFISKTTIYLPRINRYSTMTADVTNGAGAGGDSRPVFFFDIDNCVSATANCWFGVRGNAVANLRCLFLAVL